MSKWVETITYMSIGTELDFIYIRTIFKLNRFSLSEYIRIVKYKEKDNWLPVSPTGEILFKNDNEYNDNTSLFYDRAITFNDSFGGLNYFNKLIYRITSAIFNRTTHMKSFDKISKSKYMNLEFVDDIVRKYYKIFTREEKLKELGI